MQIIQVHILLIAILAALVCAVPGVFLYLRGLALMSDAISHAVLLGIALMFLLVKRLDSPLLFIGAIIAGLGTVLCSEYLLKIKYIKKNVAIALVFPVFFSLGVILISMCARNVHLDTDMILLGELIFAPFNRLLIGGIDMGPIAFWQLGLVALLNCLFIIFCYKQLIFCSFDQENAFIQDIPVYMIHYGLMIITSITVVAVFDAVGSIMTVAFITCPAAISYFVSRTIKTMLLVSCIVAISASLIGYATAHSCDLAIAGCITMWLGIFFLLALLCSPIKGILIKQLIHRKMRRCYEQQLLEMIIEADKHVTIEKLINLTGWPRKHIQNHLEKINKAL